MYSATVSLSSSIYPTIGELRFTFTTLKQFLEQQSNDNETQHMVAGSILRKLNEYSEIIDETSQLAALLDPCNKRSAFTRDTMTAAITALRNKTTIYTLPDLATLSINMDNTTSFSRINARAHLRSLTVSNQTTEDLTEFTIADEVNQYVALPENDFCEPLLWWKAHEKEFPIIAQIAHDYLAVQATSVPSEQAFSVAGLTITKLRNRLTPQTARACMCLKSWIKEEVGKENEYGITDFNIEDIEEDIQDEESNNEDELYYSDESNEQ
jgi:hypothetical protein